MGFAPGDREELRAFRGHSDMVWAIDPAPVVVGSSGKKVTAPRSSGFCFTNPLVAKEFACATFFADNGPNLTQATRPSLILQHRDDTLAPLGLGQTFVDHLPHSEQWVMNVSRYCAHMLAPARVIDAMQQFFAATTMTLLTVLARWAVGCGEQLMAWFSTPELSVTCTP